MKKLINDPKRVVREMLEGLADLSPGLALLQDENVIVRSDLASPAGRKVAVISGGGAGHEPAHAGNAGSPSPIARKAACSTCRIRRRRSTSPPPRTGRPGSPASVTSSSVPLWRSKAFTEQASAPTLHRRWSNCSAK